MSRVLVVEYDKLPPSDNTIKEIGYFFIRGQKKKQPVIRYSTEAENYKKELVRWINDEYFHAVQVFARGHLPEMLYCLQITFEFPQMDILTAGWLQVSHGERKAKNPYKRLDVGNRRKLLEDSLSEATGIDDSLFWEGDNIKLVSADGDPHVTLMLEERDPVGFGVPEPYLRGLHGR